MSTNVKEPSSSTEVILTDSNNSYNRSFMMESDTPLFEIVVRLKRGDQTVMLRPSSTMFSDYPRSESETTRENSFEPSTGKPLKDSKFTLSHSQSLDISSLCETLVKRSESLRQRLMPMAGYARVITLPELQQVASLVLLMTSGLEEISRTLKSAFGVSSWPTEE